MNVVGPLKNNKWELLDCMNEGSPRDVLGHAPDVCAILLTGYIILQE